MTRACAAFGELVKRHAEGELTGLEEDRLAEHLKGCAACQAEVRSSEHLLADLAPSPLSAKEAELLRSLSTSVKAKAFAQERSRRWQSRALWGLALAAALLAFMVPRGHLFRPEGRTVMAAPRAGAIPAQPLSKDSEELAEDARSAEPEDVALPEGEDESVAQDALAFEDLDMGESLDNG